MAQISGSARAGLAFPCKAAALWAAPRRSPLHDLRTRLAAGTNDERPLVFTQSLPANIEGAFSSGNFGIIKLERRMTHAHFRPARHRDARLPNGVALDIAPSANRFSGPHARYGIASCQHRIRFNVVWRFVQELSLFVGRK